jgi:hypothetical protein
MEGEKIKIFGRTHMHYEERIKSPHFQPRIPDLRAINRRYWYIYNCLIFILNIFLNLF